MSQKRVKSWGFAEFGRGGHSSCDGVELSSVELKELAEWYSKSDWQTHFGLWSAEEILYARTYGVAPREHKGLASKVNCVVLTHDQCLQAKTRYFRASKEPRLLEQFRTLWRRPESELVSFTNSYGPIVGGPGRILIPVRLLRLESYLFDEFATGLQFLRQDAKSEGFNHRLRKAMENHWSEYGSIQPDFSAAMLNQWPMIRGVTSSWKSPMPIQFTPTSWRRALEAYLQSTLSCLFKPAYLLQRDGVRVKSNHLLGSIYGIYLDSTFQATLAVRKCPICDSDMTRPDGSLKRIHAQTCGDPECKQIEYRKRKRAGSV